jgi:hypothetical protein
MTMGSFNKPLKRKLSYFCPVSMLIGDIFTVLYIKHKVIMTKAVIDKLWIFYELIPSQLRRNLDTTAAIIV